MNVSQTVFCYSFRQQIEMNTLNGINRVLLIAEKKVHFCWHSVRRRPRGEQSLCLYTQRQIIYLIL